MNKEEYLIMFEVPVWVSPRSSLATFIQMNRLIVILVIDT